MKKNQKNNNLTGQTIIELSFCILVLFAMVYGLIHAFKWAGTDQAMRLRTHEELMSSNALKNKNYSSRETSGVLQQLEPNFYNPGDMNTIFRDAL